MKMVVAVPVQVRSWFYHHYHLCTATTILFLGIFTLLFHAGQVLCFHTCTGNNVYRYYYNINNNIQQLQPALAESKHHHRYRLITIICASQEHYPSYNSTSDNDDDDEKFDTSLVDSGSLTDEHYHTNHWNRRRVLTTAATVVGSTSLSTTKISYSVAAAISSDSIEEQTTTTTTTVLNCLQDLPYYDPTVTVRLYLCRHGETDYNRNHIIQGARIDPPINEFGIEQAKLLGQTLRSIQPSATSKKMMVVHSPLLRAEQTARIVAEQMSGSQQQQSTATAMQLRLVDTIGEVDFGSIAEGAPVQQYRNELISLYTSWALGNYSARMTAGGESGIEILNRIGMALRTMIDMAGYETQSSSLIAITHSSYLRLLLGAVQDFRLFSATLPQSNCGINVIDFPHPATKSASASTSSLSTTLTLNNVFGDDDNIVRIPKGNVIRINEKRHLSLIPSSERGTTSLPRIASF